MIIEQELFRVLSRHQIYFSWRRTRSELLTYLQLSDINRCRNWPYTLPVGKIVILKNASGKTIKVLREKPI